MAKIQRKTQKIFAGSTTSDQITAFGTAKTTNPIYTTDLDTIQTDTYTQGWTPSLMSDLAPYLQDSNALWYLVTTQLAYLFQQGIAEWDAGTEYVKGSWVKSGGSIYESLIDNNINHQVIDINYWQKADFTYGGLPIGTIYSSVASDSFVPYGSVACDGAEYSGITFKDLFDNYLITGKLATCTYGEYAQSLSTYGNCAKFAIDTVNKTFKVPTISNGTFIEQGTNNACHNAGLPNITGTFTALHQRPADIMATGAFEYTDQAIGENGERNSEKETPLFSFDASRSNSIYGASTTVQPKAVELRYFVVISTGDLNKADMDWSEYMVSLQGKANKNLDNIDATDDAKANIIGWSMPDYSSPINVSINVDYVVLSKGWIRWNYTNFQAGNKYFYVNNIQFGEASSGGNYLNSNTFLIPVSEGDVVKAEAGTCTFYPMKGNN